MIHAAVRAGFEPDSSHLNLRFPAGDMPDVARKVVLVSRTRDIGDTFHRGHPPEALHLDFKPDGKLDLSRSTLKAPSTCHLQLLKNMGVKAGLTAAAIVMDNELWGMISFHRYTRAVTTTVEDRTLVEMAASVSPGRGWRCTAGKRP